MAIEAFSGRRSLDRHLSSSGGALVSICDISTRFVSGAEFNSFWWFHLGDDGSEAPEMLWVLHQSAIYWGISKNLSEETFPVKLCLSLLSAVLFGVPQG